MFPFGSFYFGLEMTTAVYLKGIVLERVISSAWMNMCPHFAGELQWNDRIERAGDSAPSLVEKSTQTFDLLIAQQRLWLEICSRLLERLVSHRFGGWGDVCSLVFSAFVTEAPAHVVMWSTNSCMAYIHAPEQRFITHWRIRLKVVLGWLLIWH